MIVNELVIYILVNILLKQKIEMFEQGMIVKTIFTCSSECSCINC